MKHIAFCLDHAYGHIIPTLGISLELIRRGHRVSYVVPPSFSPGISRIGATPVIINPLSTHTRSKVFPHLLSEDGSYDLEKRVIPNFGTSTQIRAERTRHSLPQIEDAFSNDKPDLIIHDDSNDVAGRSFADKWHIPRVRHYPAIVEPQHIRSYFSEDQLILVPVPRFINDDSELLDERFQFIGFIPEGREQFFEPWDSRLDTPDTILVSVTTGLLPQTEFCMRAIHAFSGRSMPVVLSIGSNFDPSSEIHPDSLSVSTANIRINRYSSNLPILRNTCVLISQGGQGTTLEALYSGVPIIVLSPSQAQDMVARRVNELALGLQLNFTSTTAEDLFEATIRVARDLKLLARVKAAQKSMQEDRGAHKAANLIEACL